MGVNAKILERKGVEKQVLLTVHTAMDLPPYDDNRNPNLDEKYKLDRTYVVGYYDGESDEEENVWIEEEEKVIREVRRRKRTPKQIDKDNKKKEKQVLSAMNLLHSSEKATSLNQDGDSDAHEGPDLMNGMAILEEDDEEENEEDEEEEVGHIDDDAYYETVHEEQIVKTPKLING